MAASTPGVAGIEILLSEGLRQVLTIQYYSRELDFKLSVIPQPGSHEFSLVAGLSVWAFDYFATIEGEIRLIWTNRHLVDSFPRTAFLYCRYGILVQMILYLLSRMCILSLKMSWSCM